MTAPSAHKYMLVAKVLRAQYAIHWLLNPIEDETGWLLKAVGEWLQHKPEKPPLCLICDYEFRQIFAEAFVGFIWSERATGKPLNTLISALCPTCSDKSDQEILQFVCDHRAEQLMGSDRSEARIYMDQPPTTRKQ
jgi:hypothetical protein